MKRLAWGLAGVLWAGTTAVGVEPAYPDTIGRLGAGSPTGRIFSGLVETEYRPFSLRGEERGDRPAIGHGLTYSGRTYLDRSYRVEDVRTGRRSVEETMIKIERPKGLFPEMKILGEFKGR